ncbi:MAG: FG-GAP-like repeat-containing protein, partial [Acidobacteriaceae bacterium]
MKSWSARYRLIAVACTVVILGLSSRAEAAAGRTVGSYQVSQYGAATYTIPLWAPKGPGDLEPHIALVYNSQSGNGYMGVGWNLAGLSSIYRCPQTYAQDAAPGPVKLAATDVFCMDGQRLRLTGGSYGIEGSTYQTEIANFNNVTAYGATTGGGPDHFEVQGRDGRTYEYGNGGSSQVIAGNSGNASVWWLDKVTDRAGNSMTISYDSLTGAAVPATISWTPVSAGAPTYSYTMQFAYGANVQESSVYGYVATTPVVNTSLLASITVNYGSTTAKKYVLYYGVSPTTSRDELTDIQECADAGATNCLAETQIQYQSGQAGVSTSSTPVIPSGASELKVHNDFNGDGLNDIAYCNGGSPNVIYVAFASSSGYGSPINTQIPCNAPLYGDLLGGQDGILIHNGTDWVYYTWNGSSFSPQDTGLAYDSTASQYVLADVNGDGLPDLISGYLTTTVVGQQVISSYSIYVRLNTSQETGFFSDNNNLWYGPIGPQQAIMIADTDRPYGATSFGTLKGLDFDGDGRQDIALETISQSGGGYVVNTYELISGDSGFSATQITSGGGTSYGATAFLDFNSDGCTDYAFQGVIYVSSCGGTVAQTIPVGGANIIGAMDWDGDGRTDILVQNGSTIGVYLSEGNGISDLLSTSIPYSASNLYFAFDSNGDGLDDLGVYASSGAVSYYLHNGAAQKPDLLSSITDGYGNFAKPAYVAFDQSTPVWNTAHYPYRNYMGPLYVVAQTTFSDPSNPPSGTYEQSASYRQGWMNLQGRGFAGFGLIEAYDSRNQDQKDLTYEQQFPYTGTLIIDDLEGSFGWLGYSPLMVQTLTPANIELDSTDNNQRYFTYISGETDNVYEPTNSGPLLSTTTATSAYDNYGNLTKNIQTVTDESASSPYYGQSWTTTTTNTPDIDTSTWCVGLFSESDVSYSVSGSGSSIPQSRQFTPDLNNCRYDQVVTESNPNTYALTEALTYDGFGNIATDTISGVGFNARVTKANWGTTGQFPVSVINPYN